MIDPSTGDAGKAAFASTNAVNSIEAVSVAAASKAAEASEPLKESGMVEANQQSTKREEKDDEYVDNATTTTSEATERLKTADGKSFQKTTLYNPLLKKEWITLWGAALN